MVALEITARFKAHQCHSNAVKFLDCPHLFLSNLYFLVANRIKRSYFLSVKCLTGLVAYVPIRGPQLLVVDSVNFLNAWLLGRDYCAEETQCDL